MNFFMASTIIPWLHWHTNCVLYISILSISSIIDLGMPYFSGSLDFYMPPPPKPPMAPLNPDPPPLALRPLNPVNPITSPPDIVELPRFEAACCPGF